LPVEQLDLHRAPERLHGGVGVRLRLRLIPMVRHELFG
jgi:hypothetical protein